MIVAMRGLGALGAAGEAVPLQNLVRDTTRAWNGRTFTANEVLPILAQWLDIAGKFESVAPSVGSIPDAQVSEISRIRQRLEELVTFFADVADAGSDYQYSSSDALWLQVRTATLAPVIWLSGVIEMHGIAQAAYGRLLPDAVRAIAELPGNIVRIAADLAADIVANAARPFLGEIPRWVGPVLVGGLALGLGLYAYRTVRRVTP